MENAIMMQTTKKFLTRKFLCLFLSTITLVFIFKILASFYEFSSAVFLLFVFISTALAFLIIFKEINDFLIAPLKIFTDQLNTNKPPKKQTHFFKKQLAELEEIRFACEKLPKEQA